MILSLENCATTIDAMYINPLLHVSATKQLRITKIVSRIFEIGVELQQL